VAKYLKASLSSDGVAGVRRRRTARRDALGALRGRESAVPDLASRRGREYGFLASTITVETDRSVTRYFIKTSRTRVKAATLSIGDEQR